MDYSTLGVGLIDWALQLFGIFFNRSVACHSFLSFPTYQLSHEITFVLESKIKAIDCNLTFLRDCLTLPRSDQLTTSNNNSTPPMHPIFLWVCIQQTFLITSAYKTFIIIRSNMPQNIANNKSHVDKVPQNICWDGPGDKVSLWSARVRLWVIISVSASDLHGTHGNNYIFTGFTDSADRVISVITMIAGRHII